MTLRQSLSCVALAAGLWACSDSTSPEPSPDASRALSGGAMTVFNATSSAFESPAPNMGGESMQRHVEGDAQFEATFVTAPAPVHAGLGPLFNNTSCVACHTSDGRGRAPALGEPLSSLILRTSIAGTDANGGPHPAPVVGLQVQPRAVFGVTPEAEARLVGYESVAGHFADGTAYELRRPHYEVTNGAGPLDATLLVSPRIAMPVFGLGLLEAVDEATITGAADPDDRDGDGVSGRPNYVWDVVGERPALGRFGWKANTPTLLQQTAAAYNADMGVTTSIFPDESCEVQVAGCLRHDPEVGDDIVLLVQHYVRTLGVPARRDLDDPAARQGEALFREAGCASCHLPDLRTGSLADLPEASGQSIHPYTDLLLHDMGEGLADGRPDFQASGREWRTPPLWGIGLTGVVNGHTNFLHDGRARDLMEAVLWHGGEAERARDRVLALSAAEREALLAFLRSL